MAMRRPAISLLATIGRSGPSCASIPSSSCIIATTCSQRSCASHYTTATWWTATSAASITEPTSILARIPTLLQARAARERRDAGSRPKQSPFPSPPPEPIAPQPQQPHARTRRPRWDPPVSWIIGFLVGINGAVFLAWQYAQMSFKNHGDPRPWLFMQTNFTSAWDNIRQGRWWTLLTPAVSQADFFHIAFNLLALTSFVRPFVAVAGSTRAFLTFYAVCGTLTNVGALAWQAFVNPKLGRRTGQAQYSLGASGVAYGLMTAVTVCFPRSQLSLFGILPAPAWALMPAILTWDVYNSISTRDSHFDSPGHLSGAFVGLITGFILRGRMPPGMMV